MFGIVAPFFKNLGEVGGHIGVEEQVFSGDGMDEAERLGVEGLAGQDLEAVVNELFVFGKGGSFEDFVAAVALVVEERVSGVLHVDTDLVGAAGLEAALDEGDVSEALDDLVVGDGSLARAAVGEDGHDEAVLGIAADVALDGAFVVGEVAPDEGAVTAVDAVFEEVGGQFHLGDLRLGHNHDAGGVLVDAVDEQGLDGLAVGGGLSAEVPEQGVDEGAVEVAEGGVDDHAGGLVDHDEVVVLIDDVDGDVLGEERERTRRVRQQDADDVVGVDAVVLLLGLAVDDDAAGARGLLHAVARRVGQQVREVPVHAYQLGAVVHDEAEMLVQLLAFLGGSFLYFFGLAHIGNETAKIRLFRKAAMFFQHLWM